MRDKLIELLSENFVEFCNVQIIAGNAKISAVTIDAEKFADHLIANGVTLGADNNVPTKWIPVSERLPEEHDGWGFTLSNDVLVAHERHDGSTGVHVDCTIEGDWSQVNSVTHWMPLPKPPQEEVIGKCDCFHMENGKAVCWGTKEKDACGCVGDKRKCNFYPPQEDEHDRT